MKLQRASGPEDSPLFWKLKVKLQQLHDWVLDLSALCCVPIPAALRAAVRDGTSAGVPMHSAPDLHPDTAAAARDLAGCS